MPMHVEGELERAAQLDVSRALAGCLVRPDDNPKKAFGDTKPQLALIPPAAERACAGALALGASKYGEYNWRHNPVEIMTYLHAMKRHIAQVLDGEDIDPESGHPHLGHVMASAAIVLDCMDRGSLIENRPPKKEVKS